MRFKIKSATEHLLIYFVLLAAVGTALFRFPCFYADGKPISFIDSVFLTVSAMCVTGLSPFDVSVLSNAGLILLLLIIEAGGLGLVSFFTVYLALNSKKISLLSRTIIKDFFTEEQQLTAKQIVKQIVCFTLFIQFAGAAVLSAFLQSRNEPHFLLYGLFLSVSAFCNAGFSPYSDSLARFVFAPEIYLTISVIVILGGLGFTVISNILCIFGRKKGCARQVLSLHSRIVLFTTALLLVLGTVVFFVFERKSAFSEMGFFSALGNSFFQSVTLRTAGFETAAQSTFSAHSTFLSLGFMLIGGSPGSMAGGIKTTTFFLLLCVAYKSVHDRRLPSVFHRDISHESIDKAIAVFIKAICFLCMMIVLLLFAERNSLESGRFTQESLIFEAVSAFGTVGLSKGITGLLSDSGKMIIMVLMFAGRTGITFISLNNFSGSTINDLSDYPREDVLLG